MAQMLNTRDLPADVVSILQPVGDSRGHDRRVEQLRTVILSAPSTTPEFFSKDAIFDTYEGTQFDGENHRRLTPFIQGAMIANRTELMLQIDGQVRGLSRDTLDGYNTQVDVLVVGSGPHGAAVLSYLREKYPQLSTMVIDASPTLGGQFRAYGPKPAFMMNSRVRRADRRLPSLPRTDGSINPLGQYAPFELSDMAVGQYAMNTDLGDVCAINTYLSASFFGVGAKVTAIRDNSADSNEYTKMVTINSTNSNGESRRATIYAKIVVTALGLQQQSALTPSKTERFPTFESAKQSGRLFDTASFYRHMANDPMPLKLFSGKKVMVIGGGDSALTCLEALLGVLPSATYGSLGVGRHQPSSIEWLGAPRDTPDALVRCLRNRYKNGIPQALYRFRRDDNGPISLSKAKAESVALERGGMAVQINNGTKRYPYMVNNRSDIVIDCTNKPIPDPTTSDDWNPTFQVGPAAKPNLPLEVVSTIAELKIKENTASLWATMSSTDNVAERIGRRLTAPDTEQALAFGVDSDGVRTTSTRIPSTTRSTRSTSTRRTSARSTSAQRARRYY